MILTPIMLVISKIYLFISLISLFIPINIMLYFSVFIFKIIDILENIPSFSKDQEPLIFSRIIQPLHCHICRKNVQFLVQLYYNLTRIAKQCKIVPQKLEFVPCKIWRLLLWRIMSTVPKTFTAASVSYIKERPAQIRPFM